MKKGILSSIFGKKEEAIETVKPVVVAKEKEKKIKVPKTLNEIVKISRRKAAEARIPMLLSIPDNQKSIVRKSYNTFDEWNKSDENQTTLKKFEKSTSKLLIKNGFNGKITESGWNA